MTTVTLTLKTLADFVADCSSRAFHHWLIAQTFRDLEAELVAQGADPELETSYGIFQGIARADAEGRRIGDDKAIAEAWLEYGRDLVDRLARAHVNDVLANPSQPATARGQLAALIPLIGSIFVCPLPSLDDDEAEFIACVVAAHGTDDAALVVERAFGDLLARRTVAAA